MNDPVHVIGASGRSGAALCAVLAERGTPVVPVTRRAHPGARIADLADPPSLRTALADAVRIVSCAHARHTPAILDAAPARATLVLLGSTRKFTRWPDAHASGVLAGEAALLASGRRGVMLHPTMIYGAQGEDNVRRLAALLAKLPVVPLPRGGRALVQPIHQSDVTRAILAALDRTWDGSRALVIAGPRAVTYAEFARAVARAAGARSPRILPLPAWALTAAAGLTAALPFAPTVRPSEVRRLMEDKAFDVAPMREMLGLAPIDLHDGLARTFGAQQL